MAGKISFIAGLSAGYVLGARSGRQRYDQIVAKVRGVWQDPRVQDKAGQAQQAVQEKAEQAQQAVRDKVSSSESSEVTKSRQASSSATARTGGGTAS